MNQATGTSPAPATSGGGLAQFYRPPLVGLVALVVVMLALPLTHSLSIVARRLSTVIDPALVYLPMGLLALGLLVYGIRQRSEVAGTLIGFATGLLAWTGWASYAFRYNEVSLGLPMPVLTGETRWPSNLLYIQGSIGICIVTLLFFVLNRDTRCNAFLWLQRLLRIDLGRPESAQGRNFCRITFIETVYVTWFCYGASLFLADPRFVGYSTPVHYVAVGGLMIWGLYLLWRLLKFTRVMAAIRYAIPTKAILWITFGETLPKYGLYEEFWLHPFDYPRAMLAALGVFAALFIGTIFLPQRRRA